MAKYDNLVTATFMSALFYSLGAVHFSAGETISDDLVQDIQSSAAPPMAGRISAVELFERVTQSVVSLAIKNEDGKTIGSGSGFVIGSNTYSDHLNTGFEIVTNFHVIRNAVSATTVFDNGESAEVDEVVWEDELLDLAVVTAYSFTEVIKPPPALTYEAVSESPVGTRTLVVGSPEGLVNTLSDGLVSGYRERSEGQKWMQITAPIGPGSSGGPVLAEDGRVIGIAAASIVESQNLNFAIPSSDLQRLMSREKRARPLWKGRSIHEEERSAFFAARLALHNTCIKSDPGLRRDWDWDDCFARLPKESRQLAVGGAPKFL